MLKRLNNYFRKSPSADTDPTEFEFAEAGAGSVSPPEVTAATCEASPLVNDDPFQQMLDQGRCALLLRPQIAENLDEAQLRRAQEAFDKMASPVPAGPAIIQGWQCGELEALNEFLTQAHMVLVDDVYLDRCAVTNAQFLAFVSAQGYEQESLWSPAAWQRVEEFVDRDGCLGPRGWRSGMFADGKAEHPVVGICWYEADAYARWAGKRLPADAEWVKAASWPVVADDGSFVERKYPWGDKSDLQKANLWTCTRRETMPVDELPAGASFGGVLQLIGNVWEWTGSSLRIAGGRGMASLERPLRIIRGGAYDTYFETQVTCQFQSADAPFARRHNIGFRCAVSACDVTGLQPAGHEPGQAFCESTGSQEVSA